MTLLLGVDPGATGAIAVLGADSLVSVHDMPFLDKRVNAPALASICRDALDMNGNVEAWVEQAQSMPNQSSTAGCNYCRGHGVILGVLGALHIPVHHVRPSVWKKALGLNNNKDVSRRRAIELWPSHADLFARKKDDGRAEAALIALYGRNVTPVHSPETAPPWGDLQMPLEAKQ